MPVEPADSPHLCKPQVVQTVSGRNPLIYVFATGPVIAVQPSGIAASRAVAFSITMTSDFADVVVEPAGAVVVPTPRSPAVAAASKPAGEQAASTRARTKSDRIEGLI